MKLQISKTANINYLSKIVRINEFTLHPNPEVTKMKVAHVEGYSICVGINEQPGLYVYFPTLSQLNPQLLEYLNLYSDKELNKNPEEKPGFFGDINSFYISFVGTLESATLVKNCFEKNTK